MKISVSCGQCGKKYQVDEQMLGKRAKCAQCGATFVVRTDGDADTGDPLFGDLPTDDAENRQAVPGSNLASPPSRTADDRAGPHAPAGPTDRQFRIGAAVLIPLVSLGMILVFLAAKDMTMSAVVVVGLGPFAIFYGIAALIDPDIVRAAGKFGTHLPGRYKLIAMLIGVVALACSLPLSYLMLTR